MCFAPSSCRETTSYDSCSSTRYGRQAWFFLAKNLPLSFILNKRILKARPHPVYASHWIPSSQNPPKMSSLRSNLAFTICYRITRQYVSSNRAIHSSAYAPGLSLPLSSAHIRRRSLLAFRALSRHDKDLLSRLTGKLQKRLKDPSTSVSGAALALLVTIVNVRPSSRPGAPDHPLTGCVGSGFCSTRLSEAGQ